MLLVYSLHQHIHLPACTFQITYHQTYVLQNKWYSGYLFSNWI